MMNLRVTVNSATHSRRPTHVMGPTRCLSTELSLLPPGSLLTLSSFFSWISAPAVGAPLPMATAPLPSPSPSPAPFPSPSPSPSFP